MHNQCIKEGKKKWNGKGEYFLTGGKVPEIKNKRPISRPKGTNYRWKESSDTSQVKNLQGSRNQRLPQTTSIRRQHSNTASREEEDSRTFYPPRGKVTDTCD